MKDLIVLVADKNMKFLVEELLRRVPLIEQVGNFDFDVFVHPLRDPGIFSTADDFLRPFSGQYSHAIVILDYKGCGHEKEGRLKVEQHIENRLDRSGWKDRNCAVCIQPELENWIWVNKVVLQKAISWSSPVDVYSWLEKQGYEFSEFSKPVQPKEAFEEVLKFARIPRSSSVYAEIAKTASYKKCTDPAFCKMIDYLRKICA